MLYELYEKPWISSELLSFDPAYRELSDCCDVELQCLSLKLFHNSLVSDGGQMIKTVASTILELLIFFLLKVQCPERQNSLHTETD